MAFPVLTLAMHVLTTYVSVPSAPKVLHIPVPPCLWCKAYTFGRDVVRDFLHAVCHDMQSDLYSLLCSAGNLPPPGNAFITNLTIDNTNGLNGGGGSEAASQTVTTQYALTDSSTITSKFTMSAQ